MDNTYAPDDWKRLGKALVTRRGELGYAYGHRGRFLEDRGGPPPSVKTLARAERGERSSFPDDTIARLEALYAWEPGSFEAVLRGGDPVPAGRPRLSAVPPLPSIPDEGDVADAVISDFIERDPDSDYLRKIWNFPAPRDERLAVIRGWMRRGNPERDAGAARRPGP